MLGKILERLDKVDYLKEKVDTIYPAPMTKLQTGLSSAKITGINTESKMAMVSRRWW